MNLTFADETEIEVDMATINESNPNEIIIVLNTSDYNSVKQQFHDSEKTAIIKTEQNEFKDFTEVKSMTASEIDEGVDEVRIELRYTGADETIEELKTEIATMQECILELGDLLLKTEEAE